MKKVGCFIFPLSQRGIKGDFRASETITVTLIVKHVKKVARIWLSTGLALGWLLSFPLISPTDDGVWTRKTNMPTARGNFATSVVDGKIYAIGGRIIVGTSKCLSTVEEYDPETDTWTKKTDMPTPRLKFSASVVNGKIYVIGGWDCNTSISTVEEYNPATDTWTRKADMPTPRSSLSTSAVNGKIYAIGGKGTIVEEYDPATDTWTKKTDMPTERYGFSTSVVNGKIYAVGGVEKGVGQTAAVEEYDPVTDTWTKKAGMPTQRYFLSTCAVNGKIYAIGGGAEIAGNYVTFWIVEEYDPATDKWTEKAHMPTKRQDLSTCALNDSIYAIGGWNRSGHLSTVEKYDIGPARQSVEAEGKLATAWGEIKTE